MDDVIEDSEVDVFSVSNESENNPWSELDQILREEQERSFGDKIDIFFNDESFG